MKNILLSKCCNADVMGHPDSPSGDPTRCTKCGKECGTYTKEIGLFTEQLIEFYKEYCVFVSGTRECEANSIGDFIGWLIRFKIKK